MDRAITEGLVPLAAKTEASARGTAEGGRKGERLVGCWRTAQ